MIKSPWCGNALFNQPYDKMKSSGAMTEEKETPKFYSKFGKAKHYGSTDDVYFPSETGSQSDRRHVSTLAGRSSSEDVEQVRVSRAKTLVSGKVNRRVCKSNFKKKCFAPNNRPIEKIIISWACVKGWLTWCFFGHLYAEFFAKLCSSHGLWETSGEPMTFRWRISVFLGRGWNVTLSTRVA